LSSIHPQARFEWGDIRRKADITRVLEAEAATGTPVDVALHFAAKLIVPESVEQPLAYYENNVEGLRTMLEALVDCDVKNVVFSSTAAVYGEPDEPECSEDSPTVPINPYGETKLACEKMIEWVAAAHGLNYCIFRYFNVAGADASLRIGLDKDQLTHLIPIVMQTALGLREKAYIFGSDYDTPDGTCIRDYIHVTDLAQAHVLGAEYILDKNTSVRANLGSGTGFSVKEVIEAALELADVPFEYAPRRAGDPAKLIAKTTQAKELLGWEPKLDLRAILESDYNFRKQLIEKNEHL
jgi:UDP-glucose 4-epimerase